MITSTIVPSSAQPIVTLETAREFLRVSSSSEDRTIMALLEAAHTQVEAYVKRSIRTATRRAVVSTESLDVMIEIPFSPITTVTAVSIKDDGVSTLVPPEAYVVDFDRDPARLIFRQLPIVRTLEASVIIDYTTTADPSIGVFELAILRLVSTNFENREDVVVGTSAAPLVGMTSLKSLLDPWRLISL